MTVFTHEDTKLLLKRLGALSEQVVLVGGQAVNFWAERYLERCPDLADCGPFASKDIDLLGGNPAPTSLRV